jgi:hypothetical protein
VAPALGTPSSGVLTNCTGTAAGLTAGEATNVTTTQTSVNKTTYVTFVDALSGTQGIETNYGLRYNPEFGGGLFVNDLTVEAGFSVTASSSANALFETGVLITGALSFAYQAQEDAAYNVYFNWEEQNLTQTHSYQPGTPDPALTIGLYVHDGIVSNSSIISDHQYNPSDIRIKKNITDINENDALQIIRKIKSRKYNLRDETKGRKSRYGFIAQELKECLPEAVSTMSSFIPSELRVCNNVSWTTITDSSGNTNHKLTIHDLNDSSSNQAYRFYVSNDISGNDEKEKDIVSLEDDPQSFIFDAKYKNIFIYGKQVHDFLIVDKSVLITLAIPVIQNMDKVQQEEKTKLAFAKAKISVLESENKELKARLTSIEARLDAAGI